ncbi:MAG: type III secretion system export apparatus subunit SctR [Luminiphilus sp.]
MPDALTGFSANQIFLIIFLGLLPFLLIALTSFIKFAVVISLLRNAMGIQQIPPNIVIYSIALVMTAYVMLPVGIQTAEIVDEVLVEEQPLLQNIDAIAEPFVLFVERFATDDEVDFFEESARNMWGEETADLVLDAESGSLKSLAIYMPAFVVSEVIRAFQIGFLLYLPFIIIDLIVANILLALGMASLSPVTVSLPLKLLLFVALDGWKRLLEALVVSYGGI